MCQEAWRIILRRNLLQGVAGTWFLTRQIGDGQLYGCNVTTYCCTAKSRAVGESSKCQDDTAVERLVLTVEAVQR